MFNADFIQLAKACIIWFLRHDELIDFIKSAIKPTMQLHQVFIAFRERVLFEIRYTSQVIYLEHMLNAVFNGGLPAFTDGEPTGIYLDEGEIDDVSTYVFDEAEDVEELHWVFDDSESFPEEDEFIWVFDQIELDNLEYDYSVFVPFSVGDVLSSTILYNRIAAWLMIYNPAGKRFKIFNY